MKPKMLVVEDNELTRILLFTVFSSLDFDVHEIGNGLNVIPYLKENHVDIMILDLELPGMTGDQIYAAMKKNPNWATIPVIPFTAHSDTKSPTSYASSLIWAEYQKSGKIPTIVSKFEEGGEQKDLTKELIDEVAKRMMESGLSITPSMAKYYIDTRNLKIEDLGK